MLEKNQDNFSSQEISGLIGTVVRDTMSKPYASQRAKLAVSQYLLKIAENLERGGDAEHERKIDIAFGNWSRRGDRIPAEQLALINRECREITTGGQAAYPGATTGYFVPVGFRDQVTSAEKYAGPMQDLCTTVNSDDGRPYPMPTDSDISQNGQRVAEDASVVTADVQNIGQVILGANILSSGMVKLSVSLAEDAVGFDFPNYLAERLGIRAGRGLEQAMTIGSGVGQPTGVIIAASSAGTAIGANENDAVSGLNSLGTFDFGTLENAVDPAYRRNARWMLHPDTLAKLRSQVDKQGHPLYPGLQNSPDGVNRIFNYEVSLNPWMAALPSSASSPAVSSQCLAFGDFSRYILRKTRPMLIRLWQRFAEYRQIAYFYLVRVDGNLADLNAVKTLTTVY